MQNSPLLLRSVEQEKQTTNDAHNGLLETLRGKRAGKEYYRKLRMAIHIETKKSVFSQSPIDLQFTSN